MYFRVSDLFWAGWRVVVEMERGMIDWWLQLAPLSYGRCKKGMRLLHILLDVVSVAMFNPVLK